MKYEVYNRDIDFKHIAAGRGFVIVTKTRDEVELIEDWIRHHLEFVGSDGLIIIFDNGSVDKRMCDVYDKYVGDKVFVLRYKDYHHDALHKVARNKGLYKALTENASFFAFIDTDEFLCVYDPSANCIKTTFDHNVDFRRVSWLPSLWLENVDNWKNVFKCERGSCLSNGVRWGKPIFNAKRFSIDSDSLINHNIQFYRQSPESGYLGGILCLHMKNIWPMRRLRVNFWKLQANSGLNKDVTLQQFIAEIDSFLIDSQYMHEIRTLIASDINIRPMINTGDVPPCSFVLSNGLMRFHDAITEEEFKSAVVSVSFIDGALREVG